MKNVRIDAFFGTKSRKRHHWKQKFYKELADEFKRPIAISGFEPLDIMGKVVLKFSPSAKRRHL